jgi:hypothetical protein
MKNISKLKHHFYRFCLGSWSGMLPSKRSRCHFPELERPKKKLSFKTKLKLKLIKRRFKSGINVIKLLQASVFVLLLEKSCYPE